MRADVLIIGARTSGSPLAMLLSRLGFQVIMVDKSQFPSDALGSNMFFQSSHLLLSKWGLQSKFDASTAPRIYKQVLGADDVLFDVDLKSRGEFRFVRCLRKITMDQILVEAAQDEGATLLQGFKNISAIRSNGKIAGVTGMHEGSRVEIRAPITVGADGHASWLASTVQAREYDTHPSRTAFYYSFWKNVKVDEFFHVKFNKEREVVFICPSNNAMTVVCLVIPLEDLGSFRQDYERNYLRRLEKHETLAKRLHGGTIGSRVAGFSYTRMWRRKPFGPGWILTGDAGMHADPVGGRGIQFAFQQAELLSKSICDVLGGRTAFEESLSSFQKERDALTEGEYQLTARDAALEPLDQHSLGLVKQNYSLYKNIFLLLEFGIEESGDTVG